MFSDASSCTSPDFQHGCILLYFLLSISQAHSRTHARTHSRMLALSLTHTHTGTHTTHAHTYLLDLKGLFKQPKLSILQKRNFTTKHRSLERNKHIKKLTINVPAIPTGNQCIDVMNTCSFTSYSLHILIVICIYQDFILDILCH